MQNFGEKVKSYFRKLYFIWKILILHPTRSWWLGRIKPVKKPSILPKRKGSP